jgi:hypothetical protein
VCLAVRISDLIVNWSLNDGPPTCGWLETASALALASSSLRSSRPTYLTIASRAYTYNRLPISPSVGLAKVVHDADYVAHKGCEAWRRTLEQHPPNIKLSMATDATSGEAASVTICIAMVWD